MRTRKNKYTNESTRQWISPEASCAGTRMDVCAFQGSSCMHPCFHVPGTRPQDALMVANSLSGVSFLFLFFWWCLGFTPTGHVLCRCTTFQPSIHGLWNWHTWEPHVSDRKHEGPLPVLRKQRQGEGWEWLHANRLQDSHPQTLLPAASKKEFLYRKITGKHIFRKGSVPHQWMLEWRIKSPLRLFPWGTLNLSACLYKGRGVSFWGRLLSFSFCSKDS